jgi:hypothetical protein
MKTILLLQRPIEVLRVFVDLKFSLIGFLFFKIQTSRKYFKQVKKLHIKLHIRNIIFLCVMNFKNRENIHSLIPERWQSG